MNKKEQIVNLLEKLNTVLDEILPELNTLLEEVEESDNPALREFKYFLRSQVRCSWWYNLYHSYDNTQVMGRKWGCLKDSLKGLKDL